MSIRWKALRTLREDVKLGVLGMDAGIFWKNGLVSLCGHWQWENERVSARGHSGAKAF